MMQKYLAFILVVVLSVVVMGVSAAVIFDAETGTGFVGKGDVQLIYGWNNQQLQANAGSVMFRVQSTRVTEVSWECTNTNNSRIQERSRQTTTSSAGIFTTVARVKNQITGFYLNGYNGAPTQTTTSSGQQLNSCPSGPWVLSSPAGDPELISDSNSFEVSVDGLNWFVVP